VPFAVDAAFEFVAASASAAPPNASAPKAAAAVAVLRMV
jgi:hypothetical protein